MVQDVRRVFDNYSDHWSLIKIDILWDFITFKNWLIYRYIIILSTQMTRCIWHWFICNIIKVPEMELLNNYNITHSTADESSNDKNIFSYTTVF